MPRLNKGEWSELYAIVSLLLSPELSICDAQLNEITKSLYDLKKIQLKDKTELSLEYTLDKDFNVKVIYDKEVKNTILKTDIAKIKEKLLKNIQKSNTHTGAFKIEGIESILMQLSNTNRLKSKSLAKEDFEAIVIDKNLTWTFHEFITNSIFYLYF